MPTLIERTLEHAEEFDAAGAEERVAELGRAANELAGRKRKLLGVEAAAAAAIDGKVEELRREAKAVLTASVTGAERTLSLEPLTWRRPVRAGPRLRSLLAYPTRLPIPVLALVAVDSPAFQVSATRAAGGSWRNEIVPALPGALRAAYQDVLDAVRDRSRSRQADVSLSWRYEGAIPDDSRAKIRAAVRSGAFEGVYLLAEAPSPEWRLSERPWPQPPRVFFDPLVVGWAAERLWVIDQFDTTPAERYASLEFCSRPALGAGEAAPA